MPNVFDVLRADHEKVLEMLDRLERDVVVPGEAARNEAHDTKLVEQLVIDESKHEAVEEMHFWPVVRDSLELGKELARTAVDQENAGKKLLHKLDGMAPTHPEFAGLMGEFISAAREHIAFEQDAVWPRLAEALSNDEQDALGTKIADAKKTAPTRPHPHTPAKPGVLKTAGAGAAMMDRARGAATGRGK